MNYQRVYDQIIEKARSENREKGKGVYYEAHHILPKCLGGEGHETQWKFHPNIVLLTAREHFVCHRLLTKILPQNRSLQYAFRAMCVFRADNQERVLASSRACRESREELKPSLESIQKGIQTKKLKPSIRSKEATLKALETKKKNGTLYRTSEQKVNISNSQKGKKLSDKTRAKISMALLGKRKHKKSCNSK